MIRLFNLTMNKDRVTFGIVGGDIGLYMLGLLARENAWIRQRIPIRRAASFRRWLKDREISVLFLSRLMPGTRLPTYVSYGFLRMSLIRFAAVMAIAGLSWVTAMVFFVREIQGLLSQIDGRLGVVGALVLAFTVLYLIPKMIRQRHLIPDLPDDDDTGADDNSSAVRARDQDPHV